MSTTNPTKYEVVKRLWHYEPETGDLFRHSSPTVPVRKLWYPTRGANLGYRAQANLDNVAYNFKAAQVCWVLGAKEDLPASAVARHINNDAFNNKLSNLCVELEATPERPRGPSTVVIDNPLARMIFPDGEPFGPGKWGVYGHMHNENGRGLRYLQEREQARHAAAGHQGYPGQACEMVIDNLGEFAFWCTHRYPNKMQRGAELLALIKDRLARGLPAEETYSEISTAYKALYPRGVANVQVF